MSTSHEHEEADPTAHRLHSAYELAHWGHAGAESLVNGGQTLGEVAHEAERFALLNGKLSGPATGVGLTGALLAPLSLIAGGWQMYEGISHGGIDGSLDVLQGASTAGSGVATLAALAGSGSAAVAAPAAAAFSGGMALGRYGDRAAARYGIFGEDDQGRNRSASDWMSDAAVDADDWVSQTTGNETLGRVAGGATAVGTSIVGGAGAAVGAVAAGGETVADALVPTRSLAEQIDQQRAIKQREMARAVAIKGRVLRAAKQTLPSQVMDQAFGG